MKTTVELPDGLVREIKVRAVHEGRKLKEVMADLLRKGLESPGPDHSESGQEYLTRDERTGLPVILCRHPVRSGQELSPERISDILIEQEVRWQHEAY